LVFAALIIVKLARFAIGIIARATFELFGPIIPRIFASEIISWMFCAPFCGSWVPLTVSSQPLKVSLNPLIEPADSTANWIPFCAGSPSEASPPDVGWSLAMMISPFVVPPPPAVLPAPPVHAVASIAKPAMIAPAVYQRRCIRSSHMRFASSGLRVFLTHRATRV